VGTASGPPRCDVRSVCMRPSLPPFPPTANEARPAELPAASEVRTDSNGCSAHPHRRGQLAWGAAAVALLLALGRRR
jgi:hypothetical protein